MPTRSTSKNFGTADRPQPFASACLGWLLAGMLQSAAFDYEGHRAINLLALDALPAEFPAFVTTPAARERVAFLAGEADRWRNSDEPSLRHENALDHFIDLEDLADYGIKVSELTPFRYEFAAQVALARSRHPGRFALNPATSNPDRTKEWPGFLPWAMAEGYARLESAFSYLKAYEEAGTREEVQNAQANVIHLMGVMGHFVGDAAQPLHTTKHYNGWVGPNPQGYTTSRGFHSWVDGGYIAKRNVLDMPALRARVVPVSVPALRAASGRSSAFQRSVDFVLEQHRQVEPLYRLDKEKKLSSEGPRGAEGVPFFQEQLLRGSRFLAELWVTAWQQAPPDRYLQSRLAQRKLKTGQ